MFQTNSWTCARQVRKQNKHKYKFNKSGNYFQPRAFSRPYIVYYEQIFRCAILFYFNQQLNIDITLVLDVKPTGYTYSNVKDEES